MQQLERDRKQARARKRDKGINKEMKRLCSKTEFPWLLIRAREEGKDTPGHKRRIRRALEAEMTKNWDYPHLQMYQYSILETSNVPYLEDRDPFLVLRAERIGTSLQESGRQRAAALAVALTG